MEYSGETPIVRLIDEFVTSSARLGVLLPQSEAPGSISKDMWTVQNDQSVSLLVLIDGIPLAGWAGVGRWFYLQDHTILSCLLMKFTSDGWVCDMAPLSLCYVCAVDLLPLVLDMMHWTRVKFTVWKTHSFDTQYLSLLTIKFKIKRIFGYM